MVEVEEWKQILNDCNVLYVGVVSPLNVLEEREQMRSDRCIGSARTQYSRVPENVAYDIEINTHTQSLENNVANIKAAMLKK